MSDLIRRSDAIDGFYNVKVHAEGCTEYDIGYNDGIDYAISKLSVMPSAEAVEGEWIDIDDYYRLATCSHCHKVTMFEKWGEHTIPYDFCPNCGWPMKMGGEV